MMTDMCRLRYMYSRLNSLKASQSQTEIHLPFRVVLLSLPPCGVCRSPVPSVYSINYKRKKK